MPTYTVTAINDTFKLTIGDVGGKTIVSLFTVPDDKNELFNIARMKGEGRAPSLVRVQLSYRIEWLDPTSMARWSYRMWVMGCDGEWREVKGESKEAGEVAEGVIDVTDKINCRVPPFGVNALKLWLALPSVGPIPVRDAYYKVRVDYHLSWGW